MNLAKMIKKETKTVEVVVDIINILIDKIAEHECKTVIRPKFFISGGKKNCRLFLEEINSMFKAAQIIFQGKIHYGIKPGMKKATRK